MDYQEDKRTKNLSLHDIHVGDWVQAWDDITKRYTPPERITAIFDDGTVYTEIDPEQGDPFEYDISEIDGLPITSDLLLGFGFKSIGLTYTLLYESDHYWIVSSEHSHNIFSFRLYDKIECERIETGRIKYMHELQQALYSDSKFKGEFNPQWKGV